MKTITSNFVNNPEALITLLKAANSGEAFKYNGTVCQAHYEPKLTGKEIENISPEGYHRCINSLDTDTHKIEFKMGFFSSKKYKLNLVSDNYELTLRFHDNSYKTVSLRIHSETFRNMQDLDLQNMSESEQKEWVKNNADSIEKSCMIL